MDGDLEQQVKAAIQLLQSSLPHRDGNSSASNSSNGPANSGQSSNASPSVNNAAGPSSSGGSSGQSTSLPAERFGRSFGTSSLPSSSFLLPAQRRAGGSCSRALDAIRSARQKLDLGEAVEEQKSNFSPYGGKKGKAWVAKFVCLDKMDAERVPCSKYERSLLVEAGLGEKKILVPETCSGEELMEVITTAFPKLRGCGGFEFLRCVPNSKQLEVISIGISQSPRLLRGTVGSGRVFVRPIQRNLDIDVVFSELSEKCIHCDEEVVLSKLRSHVEQCRWKSVKTNFDSDSDEDFNIPVNKKPRFFPPDVIISETSDEESVSKEDVQMTEQVLIDQALTASTSKEHKTMESIIRSLKENMQADIIQVVVRRESVLQDVLRAVKRRSFSCQKEISVRFLGEAGEDVGGLTREFWCLLFGEIKNKYFIGFGDRLFPRVQEDKGLEQQIAVIGTDMYYVGQLIAMGIVQGSSGFPFMAPPVYDYLCGNDINVITVTEHDVPKHEAKEFWQKVVSASDAIQLQEICSENLQFFLDADYHKSVEEITLTDQAELAGFILRYHALYECRKEMDHLKSGLSVLEVAEAILKYGKLLMPLFVCGDQPPLTADMIKSLIVDVNFSEPGTNDLIREKATYLFFVDFLHDIEDKVITDIKLSQVLNFFTGSDYPPPLGFDSPVSVNFNSESTLPVASTCATQLTLPTKFYNDEALFKDKMTFAVLNHGGFGLY